MKLMSVVVLSVPIVTASCGSPQQPKPVPKLPTGSTGYLLGPAEGERVLAQSPRGAITIKVSPRTGSARAAMGSQSLAPKSQIPLHLHLNADEILFVHQGQGIGVVGDSRGQLKTGSIMFVPAGVWHGVENSEQQMELLWYVSPPGLDAYFRDLDKATDGGTKQLTFEEMQEIAKKHHGDMAPTTRRN